MKIRLIRHATLILNISNFKIMVDPMFDKKGSRIPIPSKIIKKNPIIDLPIKSDELDLILKDTDAVLITHTHSDHFDETAAMLLPKSIPVFCQPEDNEKLIGKGFKNVFPVMDIESWNEIKIIRTGGQHGTGETAKKMAPVSGFVLKAPDEPSVYIAGDTIWCSEVEKALEDEKPEVIIVNAGGAKFLVGDPITMTPEDIANVCNKSPESKLVAVHMEAINHCLVKRKDLKEALEVKGLLSRVIIPKDGEEITIE